MSVIFFIVGTIMLIIAGQEYIYGSSVLTVDATADNPGASSLEKLFLGAILFIPGSYHTVLAFLAWI